MDIQKIRSYHSQISCMYNLILILSALGIMLNYFGSNNSYMYLIFGGILVFCIIYLQPLQIMHCLNESYTAAEILKKIVEQTKGEELDA